MNELILSRLSIYFHKCVVIPTLMKIKDHSTAEIRNNTWSLEELRFADTDFSDGYQVVLF